MKANHYSTFIVLILNRIFGVRSLVNLFFPSIFERFWHQVAFEETTSSFQTSSSIQSWQRPIPTALKEVMTVGLRRSKFYIHISWSSLRFHQCQEMDVSEYRGTQKSSILIGFSIIHHPFWDTPIFGNTQMSWYSPKKATQKNLEVEDFTQRIVCWMIQVKNCLMGATCGP